MNIRPARPADLALIADIQFSSWKDAYAGVLPEPYLADQMAADLNRHWRSVKIQSGDVLLIAEETEAVGFIAVWCRPDPFIDNLHVKPSKRSGGIGAMLMQSAARQLIQQGHKTAYLWVLANNARAIRFYEKLGGVYTDRAVKNLFGHKAASIKMEWSDISALFAEK